MPDALCLTSCLSLKRKKKGEGKEGKKRKEIKEGNRKGGEALMLLSIFYMRNWLVTTL